MIDRMMRTCLVWECRCGVVVMRRVDVYDPRAPNPKRCSECGAVLDEPQRTVVTTVEK